MIFLRILPLWIKTNHSMVLVMKRSELFGKCTGSRRKARTGKRRNFMEERAEDRIERPGGCTKTRKL